MGIVIREDLNLIYTADTSNRRIRQVTKSGVTTTFAGSGAISLADGIGTAAGFSNPLGIAIDSLGDLYVTEYVQRVIRRITPSAVVSTLGNPADFGEPFGISISGNEIIITDSLLHVVKRMYQNGTTATIAGSSAGFADGIGTSASFNMPFFCSATRVGLICIRLKQQWYPSHKSLRSSIHYCWKWDSGTTKWLRWLRFVSFSNWNWYRRKRGGIYY
jgi:hypothetical protein